MMYDLRQHPKVRDGLSPLSGFHKVHEGVAIGSLAGHMDASHGDE